MRIKYTMFLLAAILAACTNEPLPETIVEEAPESYTLVVTATKGNDDTTKALSLDGKTLNATWTAGDVIKVLKKDKRSNPAIFRDLGTLSATTVSADGLTATFTGSFDASNVTAAGGLSEGDKLVLAFPGTKHSNTSGLIFNYNGQDGTLGTIASDYDYCMTKTQESKMVTVASVDGGVITTTGTASFTNQQAIVRFTLTESDGATPINPTSLDITVDGLEKTYNPLDEYGMSPSGAQTLTLTPDGSTNVIYAAVRGFSGQTVTLRAPNGDDLYTYTTKSAVTFSNGQFYDIKVKMVDGYKTTNLASLSDDYTANDYETLTGTLPSGKHVTIPAGAHVKLSGATISETDYAAIECLGDATIILVGENSVTTTASEPSYPAIQAGPTGTTLTIKGSGSLTAKAGNSSPAIGAPGKSGSSCGNITISGGTITATGGDRAPAIGSGATDSHGSSACGNILINGGTVTATGGASAPAIGCGTGSACGNITITNGVTRVTANKSAEYSGPYSIGKGSNGGTFGTITIGGMVYYDGTAFQNGGETYLATSPLVYPAP